MEILCTPDFISAYQRLVNRRIVKNRTCHFGLFSKLTYHSFTFFLIVSSICNCMNQQIVLVNTGYEARRLQLPYFDGSTPHFQLTHPIHTVTNVVTDLQGINGKSGLLTSHGNTATRSYLLTLYVSCFHSGLGGHIRYDVYVSMISQHKLQSLN